MKEIIYINVTECVLSFEHDKQKIVTAQESGDFLTVYVIEYKPEDELDFIKIVLKNYRNSKTVEQLSLRCNYRSTKTFTHHFEKNFNLSPKQWMMNMKRNEVLYCLKNTDYSLSKISTLLGFSNVSHLWNFCFKMTGKTPNELRSENQPFHQKE